MLNQNSPSMGPSPVSHVIFDVDGLLLDTESLYSDIMDELIRPYGHKFCWDVKKQMMGKTREAAARVLIDAYKLPITVEQYSEQVSALIPKTFPSAKLMPGAERLVRHLAAHQIPMALASGSTECEYRQKVDTLHTELFKVFHHRVMSSSDADVKHPKPAPDCFLVAAERFPDKPLPAKCLVFEDAPNGVEGALAAGMQVVWVPDERCDTSVLGEKVSLILKSLEEFQPELFGLPAYNKQS